MKTAFNLYAFALAMFAIYCAVLMTEPGQMEGVPRNWLLNYYRYMPQFWAGQIAALAIFWIASMRGMFWKPVWMRLASTGVFITFRAQSYAMPAAFPTEQLNPKFYSVDEADKFIPEEDTRVYVVELGGETRLNPKQEIFGYNDGNRQIAIDPDFARANDDLVFQLSGEALTISTDGDVVRLLNSTGEQVPTHNGIHYDIWTQFFPDSKVLM